VISDYAFDVFKPALLHDFHCLSPMYPARSGVRI
jgi:hypothetical protein